MRLIPRPAGRFHSRLWIEEDEFDVIALRTLTDRLLYPASPGPVNIERLVEKAFPCAYHFSDLGTPFMGRIVFGPQGPESIEIHHSLDHPDNELINRRCRSTLGHECGHGILHACLFEELFRIGPRRDHGIPFQDKQRNLDESVVPDEERWFEYQANRMMASLLLPARLVILCIGDQYLEPGRYERLSRRDRMHLASDLAETFDVSRSLADYRLRDLFGKVVPRIISLNQSNGFPNYDDTPSLCWPTEIFGRKAAA